MKTATFSRCAGSLCAAGLCFSAALPAQAQAQTQAPPDAGSLLRETEKSLPQVTPPRTTPLLPPVSAPTIAPTGLRVRVQAFVIQGARSVPEPELQAALASWVGKALSFAELRQAADAVSSVYRARGLLVRTYLPEQDLADGRVVIQVVEGQLASVRIERMGEASHLSPDTARRYMLARQQLGDVVRTPDLERAITLLNELPGVSASSVLEPGRNEGESVVAVALRDTPLLSGFGQLDNSGAKNTGEWRATAGLNVNSPLSLGDQVQMLLNESRGSSFGRVAYGVPVGVDGWRLGANLSRLDYSYDLASSGYTGNARDVGFNASYPLQRSVASNVTVSATWDHKGFRNLVQGVELSDKRVNVRSLSLNGDASDDAWGGGVTQYSLSLTQGELDLSYNGPDLDSDQAANGPDRQGAFNTANWMLSRVQRLSVPDSIAFTASGQVASRNLDSSQKFQATGPSGVRAYASTEPSGDDATLVTVEWRHRCSDALTASLFYDTAHIRRDHVVNVASLSPNSFDLSGVGLGVSYGKATDLSVRLTVAWRVGQNPARNPATGDDADGTHRDPRVTLLLSKSF